MNKIKTKKGRRKGAAAGCWTLGIRFLIRVACVRIFHYRGNGNTITTKVSRSKIDYLHGNKTFCCMGRINVRHVILIIGIGSLYSCSVIEKSSRHGFDSGYYNQSLEKGPSEKVYLDITDEQVAVYPVVENKPGKLEMTLPLGETDSLYVSPSRFSKKSLDIDITTIFFKYRPATDELQAQLTAELNVALYAGWRHDFYRIEGKKDPLGKKNYTIVKRGFDFGVLAGPGTTFIGPSTTKTSITKEYNGMILEYGFAAFLETNFASFGLATGFDHLLNSDRSVWIYNKKPWVGFVVGIALN